MYIALGLYTNAKARLQIFSQRTNERSDFSHSIVKGASAPFTILCFSDAIQCMQTKVSGHRKEAQNITGAES